MKEELNNKIGFIYYENTINGKIEFFISPILKNESENSSKKLLNLFKSTIKNEFKLDNISESNITETWSENHFIISNQYNNLIELVENSSLTKMFSLSETESFKDLIIEKNIAVAEESTENNESENTPPVRYVLHPHSLTQGCITGINLGSFTTREACNARGRSTYGRNGSWCCTRE